MWFLPLGMLHKKYNQQVFKKWPANDLVEIQNDWDMRIPSVHFKPAVQYITRNNIWLSDVSWYALTPHPSNNMTCITSWAKGWTDRSMKYKCNVMRNTIKQPHFKYVHSFRTKNNFGINSYLTKGAIPAMLWLMSFTLPSLRYSLTSSVYPQVKSLWNSSEIKIIMTKLLGLHNIRVL
jgi:hypothetical protein